MMRWRPVAAAIDLDYLAVRRFSWAGMIALLIGVAGLVSAGWYYHDLGQKISDQEMLISRLKDNRKSVVMSPVETVRDARQIALETKQANAVIGTLSLPWKEFFEAFEASRNNDVAVLAIEPDVQKGVVRINAEAKQLESMLDYAASLQKITLFREVLILSHQVQDQDPEKPIRFVVQAAWESQR